MYYDWVDRVMFAFVALLMFAIVGFVGGAFADIAFDRASFDAQAACMARRGVPQRKSFTTHVVCVPSITRNDSVTVQVR